jgi:hypothetical protein
MKKPIECPYCEKKCIEVGKPQYPKDIYEPNVPKIYHEYRYACESCKKEFIHDTLFNRIEFVPEDSQFMYDFDTKTFHLREEEQSH